MNYRKGPKLPSHSTIQRSPSTLLPLLGATSHAPDIHLASQNSLKHPSPTHTPELGSCLKNRSAAYNTTPGSMCISLTFPHTLSLSTALIPNVNRILNAPFFHRIWQFKSKRDIVDFSAKRNGSLYLCKFFDYRYCFLVIFFCRQHEFATYFERVPFSWLIGIICLFRSIWLWFVEKFEFSL